jgi:hypothetical protein
MLAPRRFGQPLSPLEEPPQPVFIVGMNGSGTTMLVDSLGRHPQLYAPLQETMVIPYMIKTLGTYGDLGRDQNFLRLWDRVCHIPALMKVNDGQPLPIPANWQEFPRDFAAVLDASFRHIALKRGKHRWAEKTPQHVQHLERLLEVFPRAKFIHIIRDGRDCAASLYRRWQRQPEFMIYRWKCVVAEGRRQGRGMQDHYMEVKYEQLTQNPGYWMPKICKFLDLPFHENVLSSRRPQSGTPNEKGRIGPNRHKPVSNFPEKTLIRMERIAGDYLQELGYPVHYKAGSDEPSKLRIVSWRSSDFTRLLLDLIGNKLSGNGLKSWGAVYRRILVAWRQLRTSRF